MVQSFRVTVLDGKTVTLAGGFGQSSTGKSTGVQRTFVIQPNLANSGDVVLVDFGNNPGVQFVKPRSYQTLNGIGPVRKRLSLCHRRNSQMLDRIRRNAVADAFVAYLRGVQIPRELADTLREILPHDLELHDRDLADMRTLLYFCAKEEMDILINLERPWVIRQIAFLRSDLESPPPAPLPKLSPTEAEQTRMARWHVLGLLLAGLVGWFVVWYVPCITLLASVMWYAVWFITRARCQHAALRQEPEVPPQPDYSPFAAQHDWLAHAHLVESEFMAEAEAPSTCPERTPPVDPGFIVIVLFLPLAVMLVVLLWIFFTSIWPVWILLKASGVEACEERQE